VSSLPSVNFERRRGRVCSLRRGGEDAGAGEGVGFAVAIAIAILLWWWFRLSECE
jgi:hypothetical protein